MDPTIRWRDHRLALTMPAPCSSIGCMSRNQHDRQQHSPRQEGLGRRPTRCRHSADHPVEEPKEAAGYITDGLGHVRVMSITDARDSGMLTGQMRYVDRTHELRDWKSLGGRHRESGDRAARRRWEHQFALRAKRRTGVTRSTQSSSTEAGGEFWSRKIRRRHRQRGPVRRRAERDRLQVFPRKGRDRLFRSGVQSPRGIARVLPKSPIVEFVDASRDGRSF